MRKYFNKVTLENLVLPSLLVLFVSLSLLNTSRSYWNDELISIKTLDVSIFKNPLLIGVTTNLPLFFYALKVWALFFPQEPYIFFRALPIIFSCLTLVSMWSFLRKLSGSSIAFIFGLLFATAPLQTYYSTEIRPYALTQLLIVLQVITLYFFIIKSTKILGVSFLLLTFLSLLTHYSAYFFVFSEIVLLGFLAFKNKSARLFMLFSISAVLAVVTGVLIFTVIGKNANFASSVESLPPSVDINISTVLNDSQRLKEVFTNYYWFGLYYYYVDLSVQFIFKKLMLGLLLFALLAAVLKRKSVDGKYALISFALVTLSLITTLLAENLGKYPFGGRHIMPYAALLYAFMSFGLAQVFKKYKTTIVLVLLIATLFILFNFNVDCAIHYPFQHVIVKVFEYCLFSSI